MKKILFLITVICLSSAAQAADYALNVKASSSWGKTKNTAKSIASRTMMTHEITARPIIKMDPWSFGMAIGWRFRRQLTEPAEVSNTNLRGGGYHLGATTKYQFNNWALWGELDFSSNYKLSNLDPVGQEIKYKCIIGICGISLGAEFPIWNQYMLESGFQFQRWGRVDVNGVDNDIREARLTEWKVYLGINRSFDL